MTYSDYFATILNMEYKHCSYLEKLIRIENLTKYVGLAVRALKHHDFDAIAYRGHSGALIAIPVALALKKPLILVRKHWNNKACHSGYPVEGYAATKRYVIIDDFVCSGATVATIQCAIKRFAPKAECLGTLEANDLDEVTVRGYERRKETYKLRQIDKKSLSVKQAEKDYKKLLKEEND